MEELNILVTGNGFDLHHQMKTRYTDFLEFVKKFYDSSNEQQEYYLNLMKKVNNDEKLSKFNKHGDSDFIMYFCSYSREINGWVDFEQLIKNVTDFFKWFIDQDEYILHMIDMEYGDRIICSNFQKIFDVDNLRQRCTLKEKYRSNLLGIDGKKIRECLCKEFDNLCIIFMTYLDVVEPVTRDENNIWVYKQIKNIRADHVITFNYTNTYKRYEIQKEQITYLHGSLENENIVLGYNDDNEKELEFVYFKKYFQCIIKDTEILENTIDKIDKQFFRASSVKPVERVHIHFFGHSLDKTDKEELVQLLEWGTYVTVYYLDLDDKCEKIMKIIDLLEKEKAVKRIKEKTIVFEQITDNRC